MIKEFFQNAAFLIGGYRWWAAFRHRFDDLFPTAVAGAEPTPGMVRRESARPCTFCKKMTHWFDTVLEMWLCSIECRTMGTRALELKRDEMMQRILEDLDKRT